MTIPIDLKGKGWWIWYIPDIHGGNVVEIVEECIEANISHVIIKIANGIYNYGIDNTGFDMAKALVDEIHARAPHMKALGWSYTYAAQVEAEAAKCIERVRQTGVDGFVVDAESEYKVAGGAALALRFMSALRAGLPDMAIALSSYRYPSLHPEFPWVTFRDRVDYDMPQVYWEQAHNPAYQVAKSHDEFSKLTPRLPYIPAGAAYKRGDWKATPEDVTSFLETAKNTLGLQAANFWEWGRTELYTPELWQPIANFEWPYYEGEEPVNIKTFCEYATAEVPVNSVNVAQIVVPAGTAWEVQAISAMSDRITDNILIEIIDPSGKLIPLTGIMKQSANWWLIWTGNLVVTENEKITAFCRSLPGVSGTTIDIVARGEVLERPA